MEQPTPQSLSRKGKQALVRLLFGDLDPDKLERFAPSQLAMFSFSTGIEAHLLWRCSQMRPSANTKTTSFSKFETLLKMRCEQNADRNLKMDANCRRVCAQMNEAGIEVILLKGAALRARYSELASRPQGDTDIMVRFADIAQGEKVLEEAGYTIDETFCSREKYMNEHFHLCMSNGRDIIELHWAMDIDCSENAVARVWQRAERIDWHGVPVWVPSLQDEVVFTQVHICRHEFSGSLKMYGDMLFELETWPDLDSQLGLVRADWPSRVVYSPVKVAADFGFKPDSEAVQFINDSSWLDFFLLGTMARAAIFEENWFGQPTWRFHDGLFRWLVRETDNLFIVVVQELSKQLWNWLRKVS